MRVGRFCQLRIANHDRTSRVVEKVLYLVNLGIPRESSEFQNFPYRSKFFLGEQTLGWKSWILIFFVDFLEHSHTYPIVNLHLTVRGAASGLPFAVFHECNIIVCVGQELSGPGWITFPITLRLETFFTEGLPPITRLQTAHATDKWYTYVTVHLNLTQNNIIVILTMLDSNKCLSQGQKTILISWTTLCDCEWVLCGWLSVSIGKYWEKWRLVSGRSSSLSTWVLM